MVVVTPAMVEAEPICMNVVPTPTTGAFTIEEPTLIELPTETPVVNPTYINVEPTATFEDNDVVKVVPDVVEAELICTYVDATETIGALVYAIPIVIESPTETLLVFDK